MGTSWRSKNEIMCDLASLTGQPIICSKNNLTTVTDKPRARAAKENEMDEPYLSYLRSGGRGAKDLDSPVEPDLGNIKTMLDMVQKSEGLPTYSNVDVPIQKPALVIRKLNPFVPEFIPKKIDSSDNKNDKVEKKTNELENENNMTLANEDKVNTNKEIQNIVGQTSVTNKDISPEDSVASQKSDADSVKSLKEKIFKASEKNLKSKFARNLAMATLLKLHTSTTKENKPTLRTPQDFETIEPKTDKRAPNDVVIESKSKICVPNDEKCEKEQAQEIVRPLEEPNEPIVDVSPKQIDESIKKVKEWMNPVEKEPLKPFLGSLSYKKKQKPAKTTAESSNTSTSSKSSHPQTQSKFVPSETSKELYKKYMENLEKINANRTETIWEKAERLMKEKEDKKRKAKEENERQNVDEVFSSSTDY